jgi:hypothetical protein
MEEKKEEKKKKKRRRFVAPRPGTPLSHLVKILFFTVSQLLFTVF